MWRAEIKRQGRKHWHNAPDRNCQHIGLPRVQPLPKGVLRRKHQQPANAAGQNRALQKIKAICQPVPVVDHRRGQHQNRKDDQDTSDNIGDGPDINHPALITCLCYLPSMQAPSKRHAATLRALFAA